MKIFGEIYQRSDGSYVINDNSYHATKTSATTIKMVEDYLLTHPEALVSERVPPEPAAEELHLKKQTDARAYLASTDWYVIRSAERDIPIPNAISKLRAKAIQTLNE